MADQSAASNERLIAEAREYLSGDLSCESWNDLDDLIRRLADALAQAVPEGWKLVPVNPTDEMVLGALREIPLDLTLRVNATRIYHFMLAASPQPPATAGDGWRDIASAPKHNGSRLLLGDPGSGNIPGGTFIGVWSEKRSRWEHDHGQPFSIFRPTVWRPLPAPPPVLSDAGGDAT